MPAEQRSTVMPVAWLRALLAGALGVVLLLGSQILSESLSRAGPYSFDPELVLILPGPEDAPRAEPQQVRPEYINTPAYFYDDPAGDGVGVFQTTFEWHEGDGQQALLLAFYRRLDAVELNGNPVALQNLRNQSLFGAWRPASILLDEEHLVEGTNTLRITDPGGVRKVLSAFKVVPAEEAQRAAFMGEFFELHLPLAVTGIMLFVAVFCAFINWSKDERLQIRCFIALLLVWSLRNAMGLDLLLADLSNPWRLFSAYWIGFVLAGAFAAYCFSWAGRDRRWVWGSWAVTAAAILLTLVLGYDDVEAAFASSYAVEIWLVPALVLSGLAMAVHGETTGSSKRFVQLLLLVGAGTALFIDVIDEHFDISLGLFDPQPFIYYATPRHGLLLALGLLGAMVYQQVRARQLSENMAEELNRQLDLRTAELDEAHQREKGLLRDQARVEERRRIMRDMHDGVGSSLMSLLLGTRSGRMDKDRMALGLQSAIDELRLMIDSMDSMGDNLHTAFALFCERARRRCDDAGFAFEWSDESDGEAPPLSARDILQVYRVLQEAVTNALKHSSGDRVHARLLPGAIEIGDNGSAFGSPRQGGRGLENMDVRAQSIGATLTAGRQGEETVVRLELPPAAADQSAD